MGTIEDWGLILAGSLCLGVYGWARTMGVKPYPNKLGRYLAGWILLSTAVCIWFIFDWQALTVPLVFITIPAAVAGASLVYFSRPRGAEQGAAESLADKHR